MSVLWLLAVSAASDLCDGPIWTCDAGMQHAARHVAASPDSPFRYVLTMEAWGRLRLPPNLAFREARPVSTICYRRDPTSTCPEITVTAAVAPGRVIPHPDGGWVRMLDGHLEGSDVHVTGADDAWEDGRSVVLTHRLAGATDAVPSAFVVLAPDRRPRRVRFDLGSRRDEVERVVCDVRGVADGRALVFAAERCDAERGRLYVVDLDDGGVTPLSDLEGFPDHDVARRAWLSGSQVLVADRTTWQVELETGAVRDLDLQDTLAPEHARALRPRLAAVGPDGALAAATDTLLAMDGHLSSPMPFVQARAMTFHRDHLWVLTTTALSEIDREGRVVATWILGGQGEHGCTTKADRIDAHPRDLAFRVRGAGCALDMVIDLEGEPTFRRWHTPSQGRPRAFEEDASLVFQESPFARYTMLVPGDSDTLAFVESDGDGIRWGPQPRWYAARSPFAERVMDVRVVDADGVGIPFAELELQSGRPDAAAEHPTLHVTTDARGRARLPVGARLSVREGPPVEYADGVLRFPSPPVDRRALAPAPGIDALYTNAAGHERVVLAGDFRQPWPGVYVERGGVVAVRFEDGALLSEGEVWNPTPLPAAAGALVVRPSLARGVARYSRRQITSASARDVERVVHLEPASGSALPDLWREALAVLDGHVLPLGEGRTVHRWSVGDVAVRYLRDVPCGARTCAELSVSAPGWPRDGVVWIEPDTQRLRRLPGAHEPVDITWDD